MLPILFEVYFPMNWLLLLLLFTNPSVHESEYKAHVRFLADDLLEGRETAKRGQKLAAAYIASQFAASGVQPAYPDKENPYFQTFELESIYTEASHADLVTPEGEHRFHFGKDFDILAFGDTDPNLSMDMVFLGYGISHEDYNDFAGVDVAGRWVIILDGDPEVGDRDLPRSATGRWQRFMAAYGSGVRGIIRLNTEELDDIEDPETTIRLPGSHDEEEEDFACVIKMAPKSHKTLLGKYYDRVQDAAKQIKEKGEPASFALEGHKLTLTAETKSASMVTENVVGVLPGTDPVLKDEYVVITAHYDHEGIRGGEVYNGADDNASGTATLIMVGDYLADLPRRRSLIILLLTAEEKGLLGSEYFVQNPPVPLDKMVANLNIDMIGRSADGRIGMIPSKVEGMSTLSELAKKVNERGEHKIVFRDDMDRFHRRSDHYNFTRNDVPAIFFFTGIHEDYHKPGDDWHKLNYPEMANFFIFFKSFTMNVLNGARKPQFITSDG